ncbi:MAG: metallophosphoesterase [candidate division Zixibacteria bacterium]|nr:metallophosphoesterase [candidate division Zixibacteria bacterium]
MELNSTGLEKALGGMTIVHVSDLHVGKWTSFEEDIVSTINQLKPDFVFITGDFLCDSSGVDNAVRFINNIKSRHGVRYVPGNYDHYHVQELIPQDLVEKLENSNVNVYKNRTELITILQDGIEKDKFYLAGIDDRVTFFDDLDMTLSGVVPGIPVLLLSHTPIILRKAVEKDVNLILSGHTHGGQVYIPLFTQWFTSSYFVGSFMEGLHKKGNTKIFINRGLGTSILPIRFLSQPQIAVLKFT